MLIFIAFVIFTLFFFQTSIYYCFSLVLLVTRCLVFLRVNLLVTRFVVVVILIVYAGAVIIFIGYVSAVSPNYVSAVSPNYSLAVVVFIVVGSNIFFSRLSLVLPVSSSFSLAEFFYTSLGVEFLLVLLFSLFMTLLIVTSQYLCPVGPFRTTS